MERINRPEDLVAVLFHGSRLYRFFDAEWKADALTGGHVKLNTLQSCRADEDKHRGDFYDGILRHRGRQERTVASEPYAYTTENVPVFRAGTINMVERRTVRQQLPCVIRQFDDDLCEWLPDAFVLCTAETRNDHNVENFGPYCVAISNPKEFFSRITHALSKATRIREAIIGPVTYRDYEHPDTTAHRGSFSVN